MNIVNPYRFTAATPPFDLGEAIQFNLSDTNDHLRVPENGTIGDQDLTIEFWINFRTTAATNILSKVISSGGVQGWHVNVQSLSSSVIQFRFYNYNSLGELNQRTSGGFTVTGRDHVVIRRIGMDANDWTIHINGVEFIGTVSSPWTTTSYNNTQLLGINAGTIPTGAGGGGGLINLADLRIYNRAISDAELAHSYNSGNGNDPQNQTDLALWHKYENDLLDSSGNSNDATAFNFTPSYTTF